MEIRKDLEAEGKKVRRQVDEDDGSGSHRPQNVSVLSWRRLRLRFQGSRLRSKRVVDWVE